jgi:TolA-binding protein
VPEPEEPGTIRVSPTMTAKTQDQMQLELADSYYAKKLFGQAAPEYERYLQSFPTAPDRAIALFRLGESHRRTGSNNAAKTAFETLLSQYVQGEFVGAGSYRLAEIYYEEKSYREALPLYRRASVRLKEPAVANSAKFYTARCLEALGQKLDARIAYEELVGTAENNPFQEASRRSLAMLFKDAGRTADAIKQMQIIAKETQNPELKMEATVRTGLWMMDAKQDANAEKQFQAAIALEGNSKWKEVSRMGLVRLQFNAGKYDAVVAAFANADKDFSTDSKPELLLLAANANRMLNKTTEARALYDQLLTEFPTNAYARDAQYERLKMLYYADDPALVEEIDKFLATNPAGVERDQVTLMKAEVFYKKQDYTNALPLYAQLEPSRTLPAGLKGEALFKLGYCYVQLRDFDRAVKTFSAFVDQHPTNKSISYALIQRGLAYQQLKNLSAALKDYDQVITRYPKAKERELALQQKALILGQQGDNAGMTDAFKTLLKDYPETAAKAQANYWIGYAAFEAKNYKDAVEPLRRARDLDREQFFEKASIRALHAVFNLEDKEATANEIEIYSKDGKEKVPSQILRWLGGEMFKGQRFDQAERYLQMLTPRAEAVPDDFLVLGRSSLKLGKYAESGASLETYLKSVKEPAPRATGSLELAQARIGLKDFDGAQKVTDEALLLQPEGPINGEGRITAGDIQMARGHLDEAARIYRSVSAVLDDETVTPRALEKAVEAYTKSGNEAEAKKTLNLLQSRYPEYHQRKTAAP